MMMKLSYTTLAVQDRTIEEAVRIAGHYGLDGIELRGRDRIHISPDCDFSYISESRKMIRDYGLKIPCLTAYTKFRQVTAEDVYREVEELMPMIDLAEYLGAETVRVFMGAQPPGMTGRDSDQIAVAGLLRAAEAMAGSPVRLVIETHDSAKDGKTLARLLTDVPEQIGVLLDIIHPWDMGESIEETWNLIGRRIHHVHIKDISETVAGGRIYSPIGAGILPVEAIIACLNGNGYRGYYSLEWEPSAIPEKGIGFEEQMASFVSFMRKQEGCGKHENPI